VAFKGKVYKHLGGGFTPHEPIHRPIAARAKFGVVTRLQGYGSLAAPSLPGRHIGNGNTPAIGGLFRRGPAVAISQINAIATNLLQGSGS
jgi:hypothetical protein